MSSPLAEAFFLWTILTVVMKHPLIFNSCKIVILTIFIILSEIREYSNEAN